MPGAIASRVTVPLWQLSDSTRMRTPAANFAQLEIQLVVDQLAVEEAPGLVPLVGLLACNVAHLPAMAGIGQEKEVAFLEDLGGGADGGDRLGPAWPRVSRTVGFIF